MGLLHKRPLALFCVCFLVALYGAFWMSSGVKLLCFAVMGIASFVLFLLSCLHKTWRIRWIALCLCMLSMAFAFLHAYTRMDRRMEEALSYTGKRTVECQILSVSHTDSHRTECEAALLQIGEERTNLRVYLICGFSAELHAGDRMVARVELIEPYEEAYGVCPREQIGDTRVLLGAVLHEEGDARLLRCMENDSIFRLLGEENGVVLASDRLRETMAEVFDRLLGKEISPLARSFFIGDKEALSPRVERDFRRTGTTHLLAVSGLHIAILLGGLEWLLRRLTLPKLARIVCVGIAGVLLLMATGFAMSACRSVLMLFAVYWHYLFAKENDALTSLFVAVSLIIIISVDAFFDIGLWMSFFATLGLLTVYPLLDAKIPRKLFTLRLWQMLWCVVRLAIMTVLMSVVTGIFLLPIQWAIFRELSLCNIPTNLVMAPLGIGYLYAIPLALLLSPVPWLGEAAKALLCYLGRIMMAVLSFFSEQNFAMLSLRYEFAGVIVTFLAACMLVLLLVRMRRKWVLIVPPVVAALCFTVCLFVTYYAEPPLVSDYTNGSQRMLVVSNHGETVLLDLSCQTANAYFDGAETMKNQASTDIDALVLGHVSEEHPPILEEFLSYTVVHRLYLPKALAEQNLRLVREIGTVAEEEGCEVLLYGENVRFSLMRGVEMQVDLDEGDAVAAMTLDWDGHRLSLLDLSCTMDAAWYPILAQSHTVFLCCSACEDGATDPMRYAGASTEQIVISHSHVHTCVPSQEGSTAVFCYPFDEKKRILSFFLGS